MREREHLGCRPQPEDPGLLRRFHSAQDPNELGSWPWAALSGRQFGGHANTVTFVAPAGGVRTLRIEPPLRSEGVTSLREAVLAGLVIAVLPDWLVRDDLAAGPPRAGAPALVVPAHSAQHHLSGRPPAPSRVQSFIAFVEANLPAFVAG